MVIKAMKGLLDKQKLDSKAKEKEKLDAENFQESEGIQEAEKIKKEADRLAQLKQYKTSIEEYQNALTIYPHTGKEQDLFEKGADFIFKANFNIAACHSYLNDFDNAIQSFQDALAINNVSEDNQVKALMGLGNIHYRKKLIIEGQHKQGNYRIAMESDFEIDDKQIDEFRKEDQRSSLILQAHECFDKATELDKDNIEAWYNKGHMESIMEQAKEAVQSFDNVLNLDKNYENKESIRLFDEIKKEKGIQIKASEIMLRESSMKPMFRTKTGHMVRSRAELAIANFLYDNNIMFEYDNVAAWADKDDFRALFFVPKLELFIEHFAFDYIKEYEKIMNAKIKQYEKKKKKLVHTSSEDETNIEEALKLKLKPYVVL